MNQSYKILWDFVIQMDQPISQELILKKSCCLVDFVCSCRTEKKIMNTWTFLEIKESCGT